MSLSMVLNELSVKFVEFESEWKQQSHNRAIISEDNGSCSNNYARSNNRGQ